MIREFKRPKALTASSPTASFYRRMIGPGRQTVSSSQKQGGNDLEARPSHLTSGLGDLMPQPSPERWQGGRRRQERAQSVPPAETALLHFPRR